MHWGIYNDSQLHAILGTSLDLSLSLSTWSYPLVFVIMGQIVGNSAMNDKTWSWKSKYFTSCLPSLLCLFSGYTLACQYCWTIWINLRWIGISRLVNGPISIQLFQEDGIIFEMKIGNKVLPMKMLHSEWLMFLFRVRNTYSVIALCREEIDECEGRRERAVLSRETGRKSSRHLPALTAAPDYISLLPRWW